ncbi:MAG: preprotein translocase subunit SecE [Clostridia bacterium]|nr:preprotein translocase subunit SecE [Clostridia bacterium]
MKTGNLLKKWAAVLGTLLATMSLFAIPAFASEAAETAKKKGLTVGAYIGIGVAVVVLVVAVVLCIKFREKIGKFFRTYKSESKKISWLSWEQTKKSTWVVLVVLVICAAAICLLDFGLGHGILAFIELFH